MRIFVLLLLTVSIGRMRRDNKKGAHSVVLINFQNRMLTCLHRKGVCRHAAARFSSAVGHETLQLH